MHDIRFRAMPTGSEAFTIFSANTIGSMGLPLMMLDEDGIYQHCLNGVIYRYVSQYTGLKDKNGVEIYEGDIVRYNTGEIWFVEWDAKQAGFIYMNRQIVDESGRKKPSGIGYGQQPGSHEVEVIGNIYENPELLK